MNSLLLALLLSQPPGESLGRGQVALEQFKPDEAVTWFEDARRRGPLLHTQLLTLFEGLGTAYAYQGNTEAATEAFTRLVELDPRHILPYTLSPKVTFLFEKVRRAAEGGTSPGLELRWTQETYAEAPLALEVGLVGKSVGVSSVSLRYRLKGQGAFQRLDGALRDGIARVTLPALDPTGPLTREVFVYGLDQLGNELLALASESSPREVTLKVDPTPRWYARWWVWASVAAVVAAGATVTTWALLQPAPTTAPATFHTTSF